MAIKYIDFTNGNDANDGSTFALRKKTITSMTTVVAAGDEVRMMASSNPTSIGLAKWTGNRFPATAKSITSGGTGGTTATINTTTAHGFVIGDLVLIQGSAQTAANTFWEVVDVPSTTSFSITNSTSLVAIVSGNVTEVTRRAIKLSTPVTKSIVNYDPNRTAWTVGTGATTSLNTANLKGLYSSDAISVNTTTAQVKAYKALPASLDLSAYQQISFHVWVSVANITDGEFVLDLCSDTAGAVPVNTFTLPTASGSTNWKTVTLDYGSALGSNINSVALRRVSGTVAGVVFYLSTIIACKAPSADDSLTLDSLVSKSNHAVTGETTEPWMTPFYIKDDGWVIFEHSNTTYTGNTNHSYYAGADETVTTYKRETIKTTPLTGTATVANSMSTVSGTSGNPILWTGGWNTTDMSTQVGETWLNGSNAKGIGLSFPNSTSYHNFERLNFIRYYNGIFQSGAALTNCNFNTSLVANAYNIYLVSAVQSWNNNSYIINQSSCSQQGIAFPAGYSLQEGINWLTAYTVVGNGSSIQPSYKMIVNYVGLLGGNLSGINMYGKVIKQIHTATGNASVVLAPNYQPIVINDIGTCTKNTVVVNRTINSTAGIDVNAGSIDSGSYPAGTNAIDRNINFNNVSFGDDPILLPAYGSSHTGSINYTNSNLTQPHASFNWLGSIKSESSTVHGSGGIAWRVTPSSNGYTGEFYPLALSLGKFACSANNLVTVSAWVYKTDATVQAKLYTSASQLTGMVADYGDTATTNSAWEQLSISFTPTQSGVIEVFVHVWDSSTSGSVVVDDVTFTQA